MIECADLTKSYGAARGVEGLTFRAEPGEVLGFLGPNGAGKTTAIKVLTGYFPPASGEARVAGADVAREPFKARSATGYLPENAPLYPNMTIEGYLGFMLQMKRPLFSRAQRAAEVDRVLAAVDLIKRRGQRIGDLSKGLRQRAGLAQAIAGDPSVIILDEPTAGLDPEQARSARELIRSLARDGKTVMLSTHILSEVEALADKVVIIHEGRIVAQGRPDELCERDERAFDLVLESANGDKGGSALLEKLSASLKKNGKDWSVKKDESRQPGAIHSKAARVSALWMGQGEADAAALAKSCQAAGWSVAELRRRRPGLEEAFMRAISQELGQRSFTDLAPVGEKKKKGD
jgi:ABC-2 type transport system ATP-binding protein